MASKTLSPRLAHTEMVRNELAEVKLSVQNSLGWNDAQYSQFQMSQGLAWLKHTYDRDQLQILNGLSTRKPFWSWWRMHWLARDKEYLNMSSMLFPHEKEAYYRELQDFRTLTYTPHRSVINLLFKI